MKYIHYLLLVLLVVMAWSLIHPKDYFTWLLEVLPVLISLFVLVVTYKNFKLTNFLYTCLLIHAIILCIGAKYTYAEVPAFNWIRDVFHQSRNNYDKVGHFAQGFIPALIVREVLIRKNLINSRKWMNFIVVSICLAISATYEFFEWFVSVLSGEAGDSFLGTQGYIWDTQSDMLFATIGAILALISLSKLHDKQINKIIANLKLN